MSAAVLAVAVVLAISPTARADLSRGVIAAFKSQVVISKGELPVGKNDKETISKIKKEQLKELTGTAQEDVTSWFFHYTAFLSKTGAKNLKMEFLKGGKLAADKQLDGIDPKSAILEGDISINEDEGLAKGNTYQIQLVTGGGAVVAKTTLLMK
jgi:type 1 glutamine amidotransferase